MRDSGFLVSLICSNTFSALVLVSCASTNITSRGPSMIVEFTQNWSSGDVNTVNDNARWPLADDDRSMTNASPRDEKPLISYLPSAAIGEQFDTGDEAGIIGRQEQCGLCNFVGLSHTTHGDSGHDPCDRV